MLNKDGICCTTKYELNVKSRPKQTQEEMAARLAGKSTREALSKNTL